MAGETAIPSCVMLTRLMMLVVGLLTMWPLAIQTATDVGIKAAATDDQRDIDKVHPQIVVLTHEAVALWETAFEAAHNGVNVKKEEIGTDR